MTDSKVAVAVLALVILAALALLTYGAAHEGGTSGHVGPPEKQAGMVQIAR